MVGMAGTLPLGPDSGLESSHLRQGQPGPGALPLVSHVDVQPAEPVYLHLDGVAILVEAENGARSALLVDGIQGQRQVVIKSLEANYGRVPGIAAATILGDGRVALILDVDAVVATSRVEGNFFNSGMKHAAE